MSAEPTPYRVEPAATGIEAQVCRDIARRQQMGLAKYGTTVAANPLPLDDWLQHAYEEALDLAIYLRRAMAERQAATLRRVAPIAGPWPLTPNQRATLDALLVHGSNKMIARALGLSVNQVSHNMKCVLKAMGAHNRLQAAQMWHQARLDGTHADPGPARKQRGGRKQPNPTPPTTPPHDTTEHRTMQ